MRRTTLRGLIEPTAVYLRGKVASSDSVISPITGQRAALIQWTLFSCGPAEAFDQLLATGLFGSALLFKIPGGLVRIPTADLEVYFAAANAIAQPVPPNLPAPFRQLATTAQAHACAARGELYYRELRLMSGRPVRLRATVSPIAGTGHYRVPADVQFTVCGDRETSVLSVDVPEMA
ncbi:MAG: hypothetical protein DRI90_11070 [Deltaproteobacteria bacterium]|nr:MAG: hypothetical protein DRI90_11070 [Deltaproteobacteria bacterium]